MNLISSCLPSSVRLVSQRQRRYSRQLGLETWRAMSSAWVIVVVCTILPTCGLSQEPPPVIVSRVIEADVRSGYRAVGSVMPLRKTTIGSAVEGRVEEFLVDAGDSVRQGDTLAQLRTSTLEIEQAAARAELELARQRLKELENGFRPEDVAEAEAMYQQAQVTLKSATANLARIEQLADQGATSDSELDNARERADAARFAVKAAEALYHRMKTGPRPESIAQARAQVELQRQKLNLIDDRIEKYTIVAPFDGYVASEFTEVGEWIKQGDPVVELIEMTQVEIETPVIAEAAVAIEQGDAVRIEFPELPNEVLTGTIHRVVPVAVPRSRTFPIRVRLANPVDNGTPRLLAGMMARVELAAGQEKRLPLVPKDALVLNGDDRAVYIVDLAESSKQPSIASDPKKKQAAERIGVVRKVPVTLGVAVDDRIQVTGELTANELVVVVGNERLRPGTSVTIVDEIDNSDERDPESN